MLRMKNNHKLFAAYAVTALKLLKHSMEHAYALMNGCISIYNFDEVPQNYIGKRRLNTLAPEQ